MNTSVTSSTTLAKSRPHTNSQPETRFQGDESSNTRGYDEKSFDVSNDGEDDQSTSDEDVPVNELNTVNAIPKRPLPMLRQNTATSGIACPYTGPNLFNPLSRSTSHNGDLVSRTTTRRPSNASERTVTKLPSQLVTVSRVSTDALGNTYPEGGLQAWLCVFGSFSGMMAALGLVSAREDSPNGCANET